MLDLAAFLAKSIVTAGIFLLFYSLALRNRRFHRYNRFYLIGSLLLSVVIPFINLRLYAVEHPLAEATNNASEQMQFVGAANAGLSAENLMLVIGSAISLFLVICLLVKITWVYRMIAKHESRPMNGFYFIETYLKEAPFSFLNKLFWKKTISLDEPAGQKIFIHELTHIREMHTYDKLFSQLLVCIFWMNPFYWLIQRELNVIHEFLADEKSISAGDTQGFAEMLLRAHNEGSYLNPIHPFFNSSVKRRLAMVSETRQPVCSGIKKFGVLPVTALIVLLFSFTVVVHDNTGREFPKEIALMKTPDVSLIYSDTIPQKKQALQQQLKRNEKKGERSSNKNTIRKPVTHIKKEKPDDATVIAMKTTGNSTEKIISEKYYSKPKAIKESLKNNNQGEKKSLIVSSSYPKIPYSILKDQDVTNGKKGFESTKKALTTKSFKPISEGVKPQPVK